MRDANYFTHPQSDWQRRYEALRASFVERLPAKVVADRFGYSPQYVHFLRHQFRTGKIDFDEPGGEPNGRRRVTAEVRAKIRAWREQRLSAGDIVELLSEDGIEISVRTVERVLAEEGFSKLPRRTRLQIGATVKGATVPERTHPLDLASLDGAHFEAASTGVFLFAPFLAQLDLAGVVEAAGLRGSRQIPALNYLLAFLSLKLIGNERYAHVGDHAFDRGLGLFAGLNVLPKCTTMSTYSYGLDEAHIVRLQQAFIQRAARLHLFDGQVINLDFHTVPHFGDESVLEHHWAGARQQRMKGALTLFAQDASSKLLLYTAADILRDEADEQVTRFLAFWRKVRRKVKPTFIFDSRFTTYQHLAQLQEAQIKFITVRRRGKKLLAEVDRLTDWQTIHIPHAKRKHPRPQVHVSTVHLPDYGGHLRQIILRGNGHEKPTFLITNDFETPVELIVGNYARRWRGENGIAEAGKFFHLNALSSPILIKVHFDVALTMVADTLYTMLAQKLRGFEECHAPKVYRHFVQGKGTLAVKGNEITVTFPRRAHNPILRNVPWHRLPNGLLTPKGATLKLQFR